MLTFRPSRAKAKVQASVGQDINRRRHLRQHSGMAIRIAGDHHPDAEALCLRGERRE
jgi:hypothetical protein